MDDLPAHLHMNIHVVDEKGRFLAGGRDLRELQARFSRQAQQRCRECRSQDQRVEGRFGDEQFTDWTVGDGEDEITLQKGRQSVVGYPALEDHDTACQIVVLDDPQKAQKAHQQGLKRLFLLQMKEPERYQRRQDRKSTRLNSSHVAISYAVFCLKKKKYTTENGSNLM